jgi:hypothetical protein
MAANVPCPTRDENAHEILLSCFLNFEPGLNRGDHSKKQRSKQRLSRKDSREIL